MKELSKTYNPGEIEKNRYDKWVEKKYFHAEVDRSRKPFTIVMPPPNITGQLHMGHALDNTMQDIVIRFRRMQGYNALWQPGTDHASIATEVKIIEQLRKEGVEKEDLGREKFLERAWEWKKEYGGQIINQLKKLGASADWDRERFTMDAGCSKAVTEVFVNLYNKGLIYKGSRIINWCPVCGTSISDAEVEHEEKNGHFWHIRYQVAGTDEYVEIATTRPETMLGDTAVAVNPEDERFAHLIGKKVILPLLNREIPIVEDTYVDKEFGTGVVKITPAHDPNDFEVGKRHDLEEINVMNDDATINAKGGKYAGMDRYEARKAIVRELDEQGFLVKVEDISHNVGIHDRCGTVVEPLIKQQWFVKMDDMIKPAADAVRTGEIKLIPERIEKTYFNWTDNIRDWCISRQLWWGHRIPAYYCEDCGEIIVAKEAPFACAKCGGHRLRQDEDTLDTWFSSALWPFSTLGWPDKTEDLDYFYPTNLLVTGYDIIFFWVIRMVFSGYEHMGEKPFDTVLFHGLVRDSEGRKMSKSLGNGIDPLEVIGMYGADALRFTLVSGNSSGNDMRFYYEKVEASRNFANKIWNASRFIMMNMPEKGIPDVSLDRLTDADRWIISKANSLVKEVTDNLEKYELGIAADKINDFIWEEFCDWYIEMVKPRLYGDEDITKEAALFTLKSVLITSLKLLHPYMPFITEEIFCTLQEKEESIMISHWPIFEESLVFEEEQDKVEVIKGAVRAIRNLRKDMNVPVSRKTKVYIVSEKKYIRDVFTKGEVFFAALSHAGEVAIQMDEEGIEPDAVSAVIPDARIFIPLAELVDIGQEVERLQKEEERLEKELARVKGMLGNPNFVNKAKPEKIQEEKEKQEKYMQMLEQVQDRLAQLKG
ncbi:valine--tRNA ligase [Parasporobacterium paucivorans]|uniref:Valine--tRNA ligase n=1 Tax=Parasporobacterium paucivorans DSM 15970 TaxID=1122934 RepID=A0A1M6CCN5_9FIRM|nr:valine--tRNA ligase [Parasporobacterium paucivorans]SHI58815.1 valyl-tRNA synthetase [Parasporobacterium paucivorans DSM 15970]